MEHLYQKENSHGFGEPGGHQDRDVTWVSWSGEILVVRIRILIQLFGKTTKLVFSLKVVYRK